MKITGFNLIKYEYKVFNLGNFCEIKYASNKMWLAN